MLEEFRFDTNIYKTISQFQDLHSKAKRLDIKWSNRKFLQTLLECLPNSFTQTIINIELAVEDMLDDDISFRTVYKQLRIAGRVLDRNYKRSQRRHAAHTVKR